MTACNAGSEFSIVKQPFGAEGDDALADFRTDRAAAAGDDDGAAAD